jgi:hypothetical protein
MRCEKLKQFRDEVDAALRALRSAKGPLRLHEIEVLTKRPVVASKALVEHRGTCLICANENN